MPGILTPSSRLLTRIAFGVVISFVLVQVVWWSVFQNRYVSEVMATTLANWQRDVVYVNALLGPNRDPAFVGQLEEAYPHLRFEGERFVLNQEVVGAFSREQRGFLRMFAFEAPFFVLVVLLGLAIIAQRLRAERELKRRQQNFLSAITHEFKTPLSTLRLLIETALMRSLSPEKQRDYLERMDAELARLEQTSEQVLASARLEQTEQAPILEAVELNSIIQGIVGKARSGLEARGAVLDVRYSAEPLPVSLDVAAFSVVMNNLFDNAVKYSPAFPKPLHVGLETQGDLVLVHVEDEGVGIAEAEVKRVFERFYRTGNEMTRSSKGVGLGLHLVKSITEAMNGWVRLEPNRAAGKGTRFSIVLPRRVSLSKAERDMFARPTVSGGGS